MKAFKNIILMGCLMLSTSLFAKGGDDVGNGGFAYKQSVIILKMATSALEEKIRISTLKDLVDYPERRVILEDTLAYENLEKLSKKDQYRGGRKLAMNYIVNPATVIVLKSYFEAFMGRTDSELEEASLEVQKRLLHEASHIWGYKEADSEKFAVAFLKNTNTPPADENRPSDIKIIDFCSCINGKSELTKTCDKFCATKPVVSEPILYVNTLLGEESLAKFGNLYNWCSVQLSSDQTTPQCVLQATNGEDRVSIPVNITSGSNSFKANIINLARFKTWDLKLVETKTRSSAQSSSFQVKRINPDIANLPVRKLKVMPVNQYTCLKFGGKIDSQGNVTRTSFVKSFYYFQAIENPKPMPPSEGRVPMVVCHDEQLHPGNDSAEYARLDTVSDYARLWDMRDVLFTTAPRESKLTINKILEARLADEFGIGGASIDLFRTLRFLGRPTMADSSLGYLLLSFYDQNSGTNYCPTETDYTGNNPLLNLLGDYLGETEALYLAEKEAETILDGNSYKTFYGTVLVRESLINKFGFYIENGLKKMLTEEVKHAGKTIYYYWPVSNTSDPLTKGSRKLFTIRSADEINGTVPTGIDLSEKTSDKRIGCIPKGAEL